MSADSPDPGLKTKLARWLPPLILLSLVGVVVGAGLAACSGSLMDTGGGTTDNTSASTLRVWTEIHPVGDLPSPRYGHAMVYDSTSDKVILFGGRGRDEFLGDTWMYDPAANTWTELSPAGDTPVARNGHAMVYDPVGQKVVLFGGVNAKGRLDDTWMYDPAANTWTELEPRGPQPPVRWGHAMAYDSVSGKVILFGGYEWESGGPRSDTWAYDATANTWTLLRPTGDHPPERAGLSLVYDEAGGAMILFGGNSQGGDWFVLQDDTWRYDPSADSWTIIDPTGSHPSGRWFQSMAYDPGTGTVVLFGGWGDAGFLDDTWVFDPVADRWAMINPADTAPPGRNLQAMVYDASSGRMLMFGGYTAGSDSALLLNDMWAYGP